MTKHKFPPRGYKAMEYPLPHDFTTSFNLSPETGTINSTIIPILRATETINDADGIEVNPSHANFAEETGTIIQPDSIVPRINIHMNAQMSHTMDELSNIRYIKFNWMPIYMAFQDMYTAIDNETDIEVEDILELIRTTSSKSATALYNNTKLLGATAMPMSTVNFTEVFGTAGLDTAATCEGVTYDEDSMWDALNHFSNAGMLSKAMGQWHSEILDVRRPWTFSSNNFTNPAVKRGNEFTYCGILFHVPLIATAKQFYDAADVEAAADSIKFRMQVRYDEWNQNFDQTAF